MRNKILELRYLLEELDSEEMEQAREIFNWLAVTKREEYNNAKVRQMRDLLVRELKNAGKQGSLYGRRSAMLARASIRLVRFLHEENGLEFMDAMQLAHTLIHWAAKPKKSLDQSLSALANPEALTEDLYPGFAAAGKLRLAVRRH